MATVRVSPPDAGTWSSVYRVENTIVFSVFHVPPADTSAFAAIAFTEPVVRSIVRRLPCDWKPRAWASGAQNGFVAPSVPDSARVSPVATE